MTGYREIVIKIPEEIISFVNCNGFLPENYRSTMGRVLLDGVELSKGHGRLIDADEMIDFLSEEEGNDDAIYQLEIAPTIIEADKPKRKAGTPLEENDSGYNCENWIP